MSDQSGERGRALDSIERAIRDALAKGNAREKSFRETVYRTVLAALERANAADATLTPEAIARRRSVLKEHITAIEREYIVTAAPRVDAPQSPAPAAAPAAPAPQVEAPVRDAPAQSVHEHQRDEIGVAADDRLAFEEERPRRRRPYALMFVVAMLVAALAIGAWWTSQLGFFSRSQTPETPPATGGENFTPEPPSLPETASDWVTLFDVSDTSGVIAPSGAFAETVEDEDGTYLVVRSGSGGEAVLFNVPEDALLELAGNSVVFDIVARSEEGLETQISISCNFGELGDCGRKRYLVGYEQSDFLFEVEMPAGAPGADGTIAIVSDVENKGKALHVFEIRAARR